MIRAAAPRDVDGRLGFGCSRCIAWLLACAVAGCATFDPPKPWEKGDLARPSMRFDGDPLAPKVTHHIYQSKEGAAGGGAVGGGGCGCN
jgi:hypothetical protein